MIACDKCKILTRTDYLYGVVYGDSEAVLCGRCKAKWDDYARLKINRMYLEWLDEDTE